MSTLTQSRKEVNSPNVKTLGLWESLGVRWSSLKKSNTWIKIFNWEFWPFSLVYFPVGFYWTWLSIRARSFFFFTASNPSISFGGLLGERKSEIFDLLDDSLIPTTKLIQPGIGVEAFRDYLTEAEIDYPFILKPDIGERGWMVEKITNEVQLESYLRRIKVDFLLQEFIDLPVEMGVFYYRYPDQQSGAVSSIVLKRMLQVKGDGKHTVSDLMLQDDRAALYYEEVSRANKHLMDHIPDSGETIELVPIGNHCKGTTFLNGNALITPQLVKAFDEVAQNIDGFYFGRFDIRGVSVAAIERGDYKILELNGAGSEPGHIYHPGSSLIDGYRDIFFHLRKLYEISVANHKLGVPYATLGEGWKQLATIHRYNKQKKDELA